jgi:hypothetical protein
LLNGWSGATPILTVFRNLTTEFVGEEIIYPGIYYGGSAWGDWNRDGRLDLAMTGYSGAKLGDVFTQVWGNSSPRANTPPVAPSALAAVVEGNGVTLNWAQGADAETPGPGLTYNVRVGTSPGAGDIISPQ